MNTDAKYVSFKSCYLGKHLKIVHSMILSLFKSFSFSVVFTCFYFSEENELCNCNVIYLYYFLQFLLCGIK